MKRLLNWRKSSSAVRTGEFMHFVPIGNVYVYFRYDATETLMVVLNRDEQPVSLETGRFAERIGSATHATSVLDGNRYDISDAIELAPRSALILQIEKQPQ